MGGPTWVGVGLAVGLLTGEALRPRRWPWRVAELGRPGARPGVRQGSVPPPAAAAPAEPGRAGRWPLPSSRRHARPGWRPGRGRAAGADPAGMTECLDLLALALSSGATIAQALLEVATEQGSTGPLSSAAGRLRRGAALLDVLDDLPRALGDEWQAVATALAVAASSGAPALEAVRRLGGAHRLRLRRHHEQRIRRLPVLLLLPLTLFALPAFVLVTFVPALVSVGGALAG